MNIDLSSMPKLGFGLMRLPEKDGEIDIEHVKKMVDKYMQMGMNYFDTAYVYHGGKSEVAAREALVKRYPRDSFMIATKLPASDKIKVSRFNRLTFILGLILFQFLLELRDYFGVLCEFFILLKYLFFKSFNSIHISINI